MTTPAPRDKMATLWHQVLDGLHPKILGRCRRSFEAAQFDNAIFDAMKTLEHEIRFRISARSEDLGMKLIAKAMNPSDPMLVFSEVIAEQEAAQALFRGAIGLFKNPISHRFLEISDEARAFEILTFASLLMSMLDDAKSGISTCGE